MNKEINKEEAIKILKEERGTISPGYADFIQALTLAIEALEQKPSGEGGKRTFEDILEGDYNIQLGDNRRDESIQLAAIKYAQQFQPPVISDEEIEKEAKDYSHDKSEQMDFTLGMKAMRKLLTNKEY